KRKQQLKAARAKKSTYITKEPDYENLDEYIWSDKDIDERASNYFAVLLTASKNKDAWERLSRPSTYAGGSKRTLRRKKAELKKAAQNTKSITAYFAPTLMYSKVVSASTSTCESSTELFASIEIEPMEVEPMEAKLIEVEPMEAEPMEAELMDVELMDMESAELGLTEVELAELGLTEVESSEIDEKAKMRLAIEELDMVLKKDNNQMDKGVRVCLQTSLQYLRLRYYHNQNRINASTTIASSLGWEDYKARCIGAWAQNWIKWRKLPKDNRGKFTKIMLYLRSHKFSVNLKVLKKYVEEEVFPSLGIENKTTISANDDEKTGRTQICPKEKGRCIHVSEFLCEPLGRVYLTEEQHASHPKIPKRYVTELLEIEIALPDTMIVFGFDNSSSHGAFAEDALVASQMNVGYGEIVFLLNHQNEQKRGQPKGITELTKALTTKPKQQTHSLPKHQRQSQNDNTQLTKAPMTKLKQQHTAHQ
ncbi:6829_t:CDS:2, partial [Gigaspora rosea]